MPEIKEVEEFTAVSRFSSLQLLMICFLNYPLYRTSECKIVFAEI